MNFIKRIQEKYTQGGLSYFTHGGSWLLGAHITVSVIALGTTIVITRMLSIEAFGQYRFILTIIPFLVLFSLPGTSQALARSVAKGNSVNLLAIALSKIRWGLFGSISSLLLAGYYMYSGDTLLAIAFTLSALFIPLLESFFVYSFYYKGKESFKTSAQYDIIARVVYASVMVATVLLTQNILLLLGAFLLSHTLIRFFFFWKTHSLIQKNITLSTEPDDTIEYGKKLSLVTILNVFANHIDKVFVWYFLGGKALAIYIVAILVAGEIARALGTLPQLALPKLVRGEMNSMNKMRTLFLFTSLSIVTSVYAILILPFLKIAFPAYPQSFSVALIASFLVFLTPLRTLLDTIFLVQKATRTIFTVQIIDTTISLILIFLVLALSSWGLVGVISVISIRLLLITLLQFVLLIYPSKKSLRP